MALEEIIRIVLTFVLFFTVVYLIVRGATFLTLYGARKKLKHLSSFLSGKFRSSFLGTLILEGCYNTNPLMINVKPPSRSTPAYLYLTFVKRSPFSLWITKEMKFSKWEKKLGLYYKEIQIGDSHFDEKFLINVKEKEYGGMVRNYLSNEAVKRAIVDLFDLDWENLYFSSAGIKLEKAISSWTGKVDTSGLEENKIRDTLDNVNTLASYLF